MGQVSAKDRETITRLRGQLEHIGGYDITIPIVPATQNCCISKKKIHLKLYHNNGMDVDDSHLLYVLIHLYTLLDSEEIGHPQSFWGRFEKKLDAAKTAGVTVRKCDIY